MIHKQQEVETVMSGFIMNYLNSFHMCTSNHMTPMAAVHDWSLLSQCTL